MSNEETQHGTPAEDDMDMDWDSGDDIDPNDPIGDFIDRIETTGSQAFDNIPHDLYSHMGTISLIWRMGFAEEVIVHCPETVKQSLAFRNELIEYSNSKTMTKERFLEMVDDEGYVAFYKMHPDLLAQKEWIETLCEMGYQSEMMEHYPQSLTSNAEFMQQLAQYNTVFKTVQVKALFHKKETPEDGDENVWGQRESHEHFRATLTIDEKTFLFDKHVHFRPLHDTDEVVMNVRFFLNEHLVAESTICIDEESHIYKDKAFMLLKRFKLMEANAPKVDSYQINLYQKDWDSLFALQATNGKKIRYS
jgi:hypothetical protein